MSANPARARPSFEPCLLDESQSLEIALDHCNQCLAKRDAAGRVQWAMQHLPGKHVLSSSFGAQSAVSLHLLSQQQADIPVVFIDTGYHFPETYRFVDELTRRLRLNLHVYRSETSPAWQEARHGQRWEQGIAALDDYNRENKVEPMQRALSELGAGTWYAGLRREQAVSRAGAQFLVRSEGYWKVHPIADWTDRDIYAYLRANDLPYHPLWEKGFVSIGDTHSTRSLAEVNDISETRFFGLKRECGLHDPHLLPHDNG
ncbi:MAG: phosphoadenylyl-sulfate reductase [Gammaproteobacteria bacterium]|nr:phosphoadenylyl-sulfate reductase [Gammaproteobacteria bacterium]NND58964.1 phosphoadenylyl-sulfate reductase [Gammaproteobacteria bacterium]